MDEEEKSSKNEAKRLAIIRSVLIGSSRTGKSTLVCRFINNYFEPIYSQTEKIQSFRRLFDLMEGEISDSRQYCMLQIDDCFPVDHPELSELQEGETNEMNQVLERIIDNAKPTKAEKGQLPYPGLQIHAYIFTIDPQNQASLEAVDNFMQYVKVHEDQQAGRKKAFISVKYIVTTKADLFPLDVNPFKTKVDALARKYDAKTMEVSALENRNVPELFKGLARAVIDSNILSLETHEVEQEEDNFLAGFNWFGCCGNRDKEPQGKSRCTLF